MEIETAGDRRHSDDTVEFTPGEFANRDDLLQDGDVTFETLSMSRTGHRGPVTGYRGLVTGHRGLVTGHRGLVTGHRGLLTGYGGLVTGHPGLGGVQWKFFS